MDASISIIITEDNKNWRSSVRPALADYKIKTIAEAENGLQLIQHLETLNPDVILLDLKMPKMDGNATMQYLYEKHPEKKVLIISYLNDPLLMEDYFARGAKGYICKDDAANIDELVSAIRIVNKGRKYKNFVQEASQKKLSVRQKEIIILLSEGKSAIEIGIELNITASGITKQLGKIRQIIGVNSQAELTNLIGERGLKYLGRPRRRV
jgi:DNA-binding NarL/FixJ family response regulator